MNDVKYNTASRLLFTSYLRRQLNLQLDVLHLRHSSYFFKAFDPANGRVVPYLFMPSMRKDAAGFFANEYMGFRSWLALVGNMEVKL